MKKLFVLLSLFVVAVAIALGLVITEQRRRSSAAPVLNENQSVSSVSMTAERGRVNSTVPPTTTEGNITLTVNTPQNNSTTSESTITITGTTAPQANVMINEFELTAGADGSFSKSVALDDGENYFSIVAYTANGDVAERQLYVTKNVNSY